MRKLLSRCHVAIWIVCVFFLVAACVFAFVMCGYGFLALLSAGIGVLVPCFALFRKRGRIILSVFLLIGLILFAAAEVPVLRGAGGTESRDAEYLIVLGAGLRGTEPLLALRCRLETAEAYLLSHPDCIAVLSGGQGAGETISEAEAMRDWLCGRGIPEERLLTEPEARDTAENISLSMALISTRGGGSVAIVSSEFHLYRVGMLAARAGLDAALIPAKTNRPLLRINYFIREAAAVWEIYITDILCRKS